MASNYPPGVTGREYEIAGPDFEREVAGACPKCGEESLIEQGYGGAHWQSCVECDYVSDWEYAPDEEDPDDARDRREDR